MRTRVDFASVCIKPPSYGRRASRWHCILDVDYLARWHALATTVRGFESADRTSISHACRMIRGIFPWRNPRTNVWGRMVNHHSNKAGNPT